MKKRNNSLNKIERMLLENRFPTLRILFEDEEKKDDAAKEPAPTPDETDDKKSDSSEQEESSGLDDLFGSSDSEDSGSIEGGGAEEAGDLGDDTTAMSGGEDVMSDDSADVKPNKKDEEEAKEKAVKLVAKKAEKTYKDVVSDVLDMSVGNSFNDKLFGMAEGNHYKYRQLKRLHENISKYLFRNINMKKVKNQQKMSLKNRFSVNESKLLKINYLTEAKSVDDIINNKFWEDNASVDLIVDNAINLTKNFENLIDIPTLIMNSVAIKFGRQAAEESNDNKQAQNEYKLKLEEFLDKYSKALTQLPDYEHYDTSKYRFDMTNPDKQAIGASNPGG